MPYFRGPCLPRILSTEPDASSPPITTLPITDSDNYANPASDPALLAFVETGSQHLANWPVAFGSVQYPCLPRRWDKRCLYNSDLTLTAKSIAHFDWAVYGFNSGHLISSIWSLGLPFIITLSANPFVNGRSLFTDFHNPISYPFWGICTPSSRAIVWHHFNPLGLPDPFPQVSYHRAN